MFQAAISPSAIGLPRPGVSASALPAPKLQTTPTASSSLRVDMLDLPFAVDTPAGDAVVMLVRERERSCDGLLSLAAGGDELGSRRLHIAGFVPGAALQDGGLPVPAPRHAKARERLRHHRCVQRRLRPA